jgi:hypothetical protein
LEERFLRVPQAVRPNGPCAAFDRRYAAGLLARANPFHGYGQSRNFIACRGKEPVARLTASVNPYAQGDGFQIGCIGLFECVDDYEAAEAVLSAGTDYLRSVGAYRIWGPVDFSTWYRYRFVVDGGHGDPFFLEPSNPSYYPDLFQRFGFLAKMSYFSARTDEPWAHVERCRRYEEGFYDRGYTVRPLDRSRLEAELELLYDLSIQTFRVNPGFCPIPLAEFQRLYAGLFHLVDADLVAFAQEPDGRPFGFIFAVPNYAEVPVGAKVPGLALKTLCMRRRRGEAKTLVIKTLGVLPALRRVLAGPVLVSYIHRKAMQKGYERVVHALMREDNLSLKYSGWSAAPFRRYNLYELDLLEGGSS